MATELYIVFNQLNRLETLLLGIYNRGPWLTTAEAAEYLRCSVSKIEQLTKRGLLPFHRQDPTSRRSPRLYHRRHLVAFLVAGRNPVATRLSPAEKRQVAELLG